ncbi:MAG: cell division protein FtsX [Nitrospinota bacterium]
MKLLKKWLRTILFSFAEATGNIKNNQLLSFLTTGTIAVAMAFLGFFILLFHNIENVASVIQNRSELILFLKEGISEKNITRFRSTLKKSHEFTGSKYLSKQDAMFKFKESFGVRQAVLDSLQKNPFPATLILEFHRNSGSPESIGKIAAKYAKHPLVESVEYGRNWIERLDTLLFFLRSSMLITGSLLSLGLIFIVSNAIKLSIYFRRDEIDIMKLVGAPLTFIRGPFLVEGVVHGFMGSALSIGFLYAVFFLFSRHLTEPVQTLFLMKDILFLPTQVIFGMLLSGSGIGLFAAMLSLHSFIRFRE